MPIRDTIPASVVPADFKTWAEAVSDASDAVVPVPVGAVAVFATEDPAVADAHPQFAWILLGAAEGLTAPLNLVATEGDAQVGLAWTAGQNATGHRVYRHTTNVFGSAVQLGADLGAAANAYNDETAVNDTLYYYWVLSFDALATSAPTGPVSATPAAIVGLTAPTNLVATAGDGEVSLAWTAGANATGHRVYRHTADVFASATQLGADLGAAANSYTDATAVNGTLYYYWATSFDAEAESAPAGSVSATPYWYTDFSENTTGVGVPSGWAAQWDSAANATFEIVTDAGSEGGKSFKFESDETASKRRGAEWTAGPTSAADVDILLEFDYRDNPSPGATQNIIGVVARASGAALSETCYMVLWRPGAATPDVRLAAYDAGVFTILATETAAVPAGNSAVKWLLRFNVTGTTIRTKLWLASEAQPAGWLATVTDSAVAGGGFVGLLYNSVNAATFAHRIVASTSGEPAFPA